MGRGCDPKFRARRCSKCRLRASSLVLGWGPVGAVERLSLARNHSRQLRPQLAYLFPPPRLDASTQKVDTSFFAATSAFLCVQLAPYADTQSATNARHDLE